MLKAFKTEIKPTPVQAEKIQRALAVCRFLYNRYLAANKLLYKMYQRGLLADSQKHFLTANDFDKYVNHVLKKDYPFISECGSKARKKTLVNGETAFRRFFKGQAEFPRFKRASRQDLKLYFPKNNKGDWTIFRHKIQIPTLRQVRLKEYGYLPIGVPIKNGYVSYKAGRYYVSVTAEIAETSSYNQDFISAAKQVGAGIRVKLGLGENLVELSDGRIFANINQSQRVQKLEKKLRREKRRLERKEKNSANREKQRLAVQKLYDRLVHIREDYENKIVHEIVKDKPAFIELEDLDVREMLKDKKNAPSLKAARWYQLQEKIRYKASVIGIEIRTPEGHCPGSGPE